MAQGVAPALQLRPLSLIRPLRVLRLSHTQMVVTTQSAFSTVVQGEKGTLTVEGDIAAQPLRYSLSLADASTGALPPYEKRHVVECPLPGGGHGMFWEADAAARALRDGKLEEDLIPHGVLGGGGLQEGRPTGFRWAAKVGIGPAPIPQPRLYCMLTIPFTSYYLSFCRCALVATTLLTQSIMDAARRDGDFAYPPKLEQVRADA